MIVKKMLTRRLAAAAEFRGERLLDRAVSWLIAGRVRGGGLSQARARVVVGGPVGRRCVRAA